MNNFAIFVSISVKRAALKNGVIFGLENSEVFVIAPVGILQEF